MLVAVGAIVVEAARQLVIPNVLPGAGKGALQGVIHHVEDSAQILVLPLASIHVLLLVEVDVAEIALMAVIICVVILVVACVQPVVLAQWHFFRLIRNV